ncbi:MAG: PAS domain S-box protein, partial [Candidatus Goldiibacteriota bacterium]
MERSSKFAHFIILFLLFAIPAFINASTENSAIKSITVVCDDNYPPYVFREADGSLHGIVIDQWALWSKKTGIAVKINAMEWSEAQKTMLYGRADVIDTIFYNGERSVIYDFTPAYVSIEVPVFFNSEISGIFDMNSLKGFAIVVKKGDSCINVLKAHGVMILQEFPDYSSIISGAASGKIKIFCMDKPPALYLLNKAGIRSNFHMTPPIYTGSFHRAVKKGNAEMLALVNEGFSKITKKEYASIDRRWTGEAVNAAAFIRYFIFAAGLAAFVVFFMFLWNVTLIKQVSEKTADLKKAMTGVQESEEKFKLAFDTSPDSININRLSDGMYIEINQGFTKLTGFTKEDVAGKTSAGIKIWSNPADRERLVAGLKLDGHVDNLEAVFMRKDGSTTTALMSAKIITMKGAPYILSITRDISERKKFEIAIAESEEKFRSFAEQSMISIIIVQDNLIKYANKGMELLSEYSPAELFAWKEHEFMKLVSPDFKELVAEQAFKKQAGDTDVKSSYEFRMVTKSGSEKWVNLYSRTIMYEGHKGVLVSFVDISELKETHEKLEKTVEKLKWSNEELERFASATSHDLQEPLRMVSNYLQLLKMKYRGKLDAEADLYIDTAVKGAVRMSELIRGILDLSRIGKVEMNFEDVDTGAVAAEAVKMLEPKIKESGAQVTV